MSGKGGALLALLANEPAKKSKKKTDDGDDGLDVACEDFLSAVKASDPKKMAEAFRSMKDLCDSSSYDEGE